MTSSRPYLLRAVHEWIADNGLTPQMVVNAEMEGVVVPAHCVENGRIVLNVSAGAVRRFNIGNERIEFDARFSGVGFRVEFPPRAVLAMVARENGVGMSFPEEPDAPPPAPVGQEPSPRARRPSLRVVK